MAKLYFRYGTVGSAKTLNLLAVAHNYRQQGKNVLLVKPALDTRFGRDVIQTRAGISARADIVVEDTLEFPLLDSIVCVLVDECQFLHNTHIDRLREITYANNVAVICYGLRTDFRTNLFPASRRLFELADSIEEIKTTCHYCLQKAVFNLKLLNKKPTKVGPAVELGCEETYLPVCARCYDVSHR
jgi:thymidine kinase